MTEVVSLSPDGQVIEVLSTGTPSVTELRRTLERIRELHEQHGVALVLVDSRQREFDVSTADSFEGGSHLAKVAHKLKFAVVTTTMPENARFFENVTANRGARLRHFLDVDLALSWLREDL